MPKDIFISNQKLIKIMHDQTTREENHFNQDDEDDYFTFETGCQQDVQADFELEILMF